MIVYEAKLTLNSEVTLYWTMALRLRTAGSVRVFSTFSVSTVRLPESRRVQQESSSIGRLEISFPIDRVDVLIGCETSWQ